MVRYNQAYKGTTHIGCIIKNGKIVKQIYKGSELVYKLGFDTFTINAGTSLQSWKVPMGVEKIHIDCVASKGADGSKSNGGNGGRVQCDMNVTGGETLYITVGAIHADSSSIREHDRRINPTNKMLPAVYSAFGGGYRNSIKPDLVFYGGRMFYNQPWSDNNPTPLKGSMHFAEPGHRVAAPSNQIDKSYYTRGTSNATALTTRAAINIIDTLKSILQENYDSPQYNKYVSSLIKAMLVHGCSWEDIGNNISRIFQDGYTNADIKKIISKWIGYGIPNLSNVLQCTDQKVTVLGFGEIQMDKVHLYRLPLPPSLSSRPEKRKLTITLAWLSPIAPTSQRYRVASLYFEAHNALLGVNREDADWRKVRQGTLQHEVFIGENAIPFENNSSLEIKVICKKDARDFDENIIYALVVTLEVAEEIDIPIYQEIKDQLVAPIIVEQPV